MGFFQKIYLAQPKIMNVIAEITKESKKTLDKNIKEIESQIKKDVSDIKKKLKKEKFELESQEKQLKNRHEIQKLRDNNVVEIGQIESIFKAVSDLVKSVAPLKLL